MDCNEKKTPTPEDKIRNEKLIEEAAELTDEQLEQVAGGDHPTLIHFTPELLK